MASDPRVEAIFERAATGFAFINSKTGQLVKVNEKFCSMLGLDEGEQPRAAFMATTHPDGMHQNLGNLQKLINGEISEFSMEKRYIRDDGSACWVNMTVSALWEPGDEPEFHLAIVEDITARKQAEEKLHRANELLEQKVAERTEALQAKAHELEELNVRLQEHEAELREKNINLQEANSALKLFIKKKDEISKEIGEDLLGTIKIAVAPSLQKLAKICPDEEQQKIIAIIEAHLKEVIKPLPRTLAAANLNLSRTETTVADLIKNGFTNKQVAAHLHISVETVAFHRKNIRRKLGLTNKRTSLQHFLQNLGQR